MPRQRLQDTNQGSVAFRVGHPFMKRYREKTRKKKNKVQYAFFTEISRVVWVGEGKATSSNVSRVGSGGAVPSLQSWEGEGSAFPGNLGTADTEQLGGKKKKDF